MCTSRCRLIVLFQFMLLIQNSSQNVSYSTSELITVSLMYRHGDRSPLMTYANDPYLDPKYWPMGYGQLTNIGKMQLYELGQYFRNRYSNFLSPNYNVTEIFVRSTDTDRTLMSAESNLAGMYPPLPDEMWNPDLRWQPIPVHTTPSKLDSVLSMTKPCKKYFQLYEELMNTDEFIAINRSNRELYAYLTENSGQPITTLVLVRVLYDVLYVEDLHNLTLPEWTKPVYPGTMEKLSEFYLTTSTYTTELVQLTTGPFLNELASHFENTTSFDSKKMYMYSAHDSTIIAVLNSLGLFEYHIPPYAATIFFELRMQNKSLYVNVLYKNSSEPLPMTLEGCEFNCPLSQFLEILAPLRMNQDEWEFACQPKFLGIIPFDTLQSGILIGCIVLLVIMLCGFVVTLICARRRRKENVDYLPLSNEKP